MSTTTGRTSARPKRPQTPAPTPASAALAHSSETNRQFSAPQGHREALQRLVVAARAVRLHALADRLGRCGRGYWAWDARPGQHAPLLDADGSPVRLLASCNCRLCPACAPRRMRKLSTRISKLAEGTFAGPPVAVTLTREAQPGDTPAAAAEALLTAFGRLRRMELWKEAVGGGVACVHFAGSDGRHVHVHAVVDAVWLDQAALLAAWRKRLRPPRSRTTPPDGGAHVERVDSAEGMIKYVLRAQDSRAVKDADLPGLLSWMHGRRLVATFGSLRGKRVVEPRPTPAPNPGGTGRGRGPRGGYNAATGEWVSDAAVAWQVSDRAHQIGFGLMASRGRGDAHTAAALPDDVDGAP
jgi:hypothetical protein